MENKESDLVEVEVELDKEDLEFIQSHGIDLSALVREHINELLADTQISKLKLEAFKLKCSIEENTAKLEQIEEEIRKLEEGN